MELPDELGRCWIFAENLDPNVPVDTLPLFKPPELPISDDGDGDDDSDAGDGSGGDDDSGAGDGGGDGQQEPEGPEDCDPQTEYWSDQTNQCETLI